MSKKDVIRNAFKDGDGIMRMVPVFIPRTFNRPGHRLKLHPDDYYAMGMKRGAICERWFSSVNVAQNGDETPEDEGMSYVAVSDKIEDSVLFKDFIEELGEDIIGKELMDKYGTWPMFCKFFDYNEPLFHHLHPTPEMAALVGKQSKPECYYFPVQLNDHLGTAPYTYFGFDQTVTKEDVKKKLMEFEDRDNRITDLSRAYRIELGTGWYTAPGVIHAPASVLTYEPQWNSDVNVVMENVTSGEINSYELLAGNAPEDKKRDVDFIMSYLDWDKNVDPNYRKTYFRPPVVCEGSNEKYTEKWVCYANDYIAAKELTIMPGQTVKITDQAAYGCIFMQGFGKFGVHDCETVVMMRYGQMTNDEFFVSEGAAKKGVVITNNSKSEPIVLLKHFGPNNPEMPTTVG